ncbi:TPA: AMP-binding protein [Bacillus cereus]
MGKATNDPYVTNQIFENQKGYWKEKLKGEVAMSSFPTDKSRVLLKEYKKEIVKLKFPDELVRDVFRISKNSELGTYILLLSGIMYLVYKYTDNEDVVIGTPIINMGGDEKTINQLLTLRKKINSQISFQDWINEVKGVVVEALQNQEIPYQTILQENKILLEDEKMPLFPIVTLLEEIQDINYIKPIFADIAFIFNLNDGIEIKVEFNENVYFRETIEAMLRTLILYYEETTTNPDVLLKNINATSEYDSNKILFEFNSNIEAINQEFNEPIHVLIEKQAKLTPNKIALKFDETVLTFEELNKCANRLAQYLISEYTIDSNECVGILLERSHYTIIAMLGVLKAGASYVPIDPTLPTNRIKNIIDNTTIKVIISKSNYVQMLNKLQWECFEFKAYVCLDSNNIEEVEDTHNNELMDPKLWNHIGASTNNRIGMGGWINSYTGEEFSREEMEEYSNNVLRKLTPYLHENIRVLEIGCASGITMYKIAPYCKLYYGTDMSNVTIEKNKNYIKKQGIENIKLECLAAHEIGQIKQKFDVIIINSTVQYFPGHNYLKKVINIATDMLDQKGVIFLGDIMDQDKKSEMIESLVHFSKSNPNYRTKVDFSSELFLAKSWFNDLQIKSHIIHSLNISGKNCKIENELTKYRYDVILEVNKLIVKESNESNLLKKQHDYKKLLEYSSENLDLQIQENQIAYVIFTSGSTGKPKGVQIQHQALTNFVEAMRNILNEKQTTVMLALTGISFDIFILESLYSLAVGLKVIIANEKQHMNIKEINKLIMDNQVDIIQLTPSRLKLLIEDASGLEKLKVIIVGGESFPKGLLKQVQQHTTADIYNAYGPTEATVWATYKKVTKDTEITIGTPLMNYQCFIVNPNDYLKLQPIGGVGELVIAGKGLSKGYLNNHKLNKEQFVNNPFSEESLMYKTGDLARYLPTGDIQFLGRKDNQVKLNGYRIELEEIESILKNYYCIEEAKVIVKQDEKATLYAFLVIKEKKEFSGSELRKYLLGILPKYMVPSNFICIDKIPLNANGKTDRNTLLQILQKREKNKRVEPSSEREKLLADLWGKVLNTEFISIYDNFFELGGNSIKAIEIISELVDLFEVSINDVYAFPTIFEFAKNMTYKQNYLKNKLDKITQDIGLINHNDIEALEEYKDIYTNDVKRYSNEVLLSQKNYNNIFLTGGTGYLGIHLVNEILNRTESTIYLLVNSISVEAAKEKLNKRFLYYFNEENLLKKYQSRINIILGDITQNKFGMECKEYEKLSYKIDCVLHSAAKIKHYGNWEDFHNVNIEGTKNVLKFAKTGLKKDFNYISTLSIASGGDYVIFSEYDKKGNHMIENYYLRSKVLAEEAVLVARDSGLNCNIYRLNSLFMNYCSKKMPYNFKEEGFYMVIKAMNNLGIYPFLINPVLDLSGVNQVAEAIVTLFNKECLQNEIFHVFNPNKISWNDMGIVAQSLGISVDVVNFDDFVQYLSNHLEDPMKRQSVIQVLLNSFLFRNTKESNFLRVCDRTNLMLERLGFKWLSNHNEYIEKFYNQLD